MFRSCDYCRYRKKKCGLAPATAGCPPRCKDCVHLNIKCHFSLRNPSLKRQKTAQSIASRAAISTPLPRSFSFGETAPVQSPDEREPNTADHSSPVEKIILRDDELHDGDYLASLAESYHRNVQFLAPFIPDEMLAGNDMSQDLMLHSCIHLASHLSLHDRRPLPSASRINTGLQDILRGRELNLHSAAGILLLITRLDLDPDIINKTFSAIQGARNIGPIPEAILAGACTAHAWLRLVGYSVASWQISTEVIDSYRLRLDPESFGYHYLVMSQLVDRFNRLCRVNDYHDLDNDGKLAWVTFEYECLMGPIKLPSQLVDLRDEMPATPESVVIHCLQNLLFLSYYAYIFDRQDTLGNMLALRPIPGVMFFLCALARSVLICSSDIVDRWKLIADAQAHTVRAMLHLWRVSQFENCKAILGLWEDNGKSPELMAQVRHEIGPGPWPMEFSDGFTVFWTFRDLRSLALEFYIEQYGRVSGQQ